MPSIAEGTYCSPMLGGPICCACGFSEYFQCWYFLRSRGIVDWDTFMYPILKLKTEVNRRRWTSGDNNKDMQRMNKRRRKVPIARRMKTRMLMLVAVKTTQTNASLTSLVQIPPFNYHSTSCSTFCTISPPPLLTKAVLDSLSLQELRKWRGRAWLQTIFVSCVPLHIGVGTALHRQEILQYRSIV